MTWLGNILVKVSKAIVNAIISKLVDRFADWLFNKIFGQPAYA